ncbi:MAG: hypothetical protein IKH04_02055, partial [Kiritimatiellae bacterium]|nr:hypothetical protein [Kiritimatiellia bacterium]
RSYDHTLVFPVDVDIGRPDSPVTASIPLVSGGATVDYGMADVRTDANGVVRFWLPEGNSLAEIDGRYYQISIGSERSWARPWNSGLAVNGVNISEFSGEGWTFDLATMSVHLMGAGPFELSGEESGASVSVESDCDVVLRDVTLATGENGLTALHFGDGVTATLELVGTNSLASGQYHPGLGIAETASLAIRGEGSLAATGGENGAGIGSAWTDSAGNLTIEGGTIVAQGGWLGSGIGGGFANTSGGGCGTIVISGGDVTATGGSSAPGIGQIQSTAGHDGSILVGGGVVTATGGNGGAGIGGKGSSSHYVATPVMISGGVVRATGGEGGAGIGGCSSSMADVTISGGVVTATGGYHGAGIGGGEGDSVLGLGAGNVRISGGIVTAAGGEGAHGVGGGYVSNGGTVEITGGTVAATGGAGGMDVGFIGPSGVAGSVVFDGGSILADMGDVKPAAKNTAGAAVWRVDVAVDNPDPARAVAVTGLDGYGVADIYPDENGDIHLWLPDGTYDFEVDGTPVHEVVDGSSVFIPLGVAVDGVDVGHGSGPNWVLDDQKRIVLSGACVVSGTNTLDGLSIRFETSDEIVFSNACIRSQQGFAVATNVSAVVRGIGRNVVAPTYWPRLLEEGASFTVAGGTFMFRSEETFTILGGSVTGIQTYYARPQNVDGAALWCADIPGFAPGEAVGPFQGLPEYYDTTELFADDGGALHLWLPEGLYVATNAVDGAKWTIRIGPDGEATVVAWNDDFTVNGVNIAQLSGEGWDFATNVLTLAGTGRYTVRGTNELGGVRIVVASDAIVELAGVSLRAEAPFALGNGVAATVLLNGPGNRLVATRYSAAGLFVPETASLTITNATVDAKLVAIGGGAAAGIGGNHGDNLRVGSITLAGGTVEAHSSATDDLGEAAAIGAGRGGKAGPIRITGGRVYAYAGSKYGYASAAIGGSLRMAEAYTGGLVEISGGTVYACGGRQDADVFASDIGDGLTYSQSYDNNVPVVITGGNVVLAHFDSEKERFTQSQCAVTNLAHAAAGRVLHAVVVPLGTPDAAVALLVRRPSDSSEESSEVSYGTRDLYADASGDLYLWLPDGDYTFAIGETHWAASVAGADTVAQLVSPADPLGVFVNGVEVAHGTGDGWRYSAVSSRLTLTGDGPLVLSGTNTQGKVRVRVETEATVTLSNLCLKATANRNTPFAIVSNLAARVWFTGTNTLEAGRYCAALEVPGVSDLEIGGDGWLFANGGATSDYWGCPAIGISDGMYYEFQHQSVTITGGNIVALSGAVGTVSGIDDPVISGGNIFIGRHPNYDHYVLANSGAKTPQGDDAACVEVPGLEPNAPVEFKGLPEYYNASDIYANAEGKVYLYLKAVYDEADGITFTANGARYSAVVWNKGEANTAAIVESTAPDSIRIEAIEIDGDVVRLTVSAEPEGWMETGAETLKVRAAPALPLPDGDDALLAPEATLNADGTATLAIPHGGAPAMFYRVEVQ